MRGKKKMGRPNVLEKPVRIALRLNQADHEKLAAAAERDGVSVSEVVRTLIAGLAPGRQKRPKRRT